MCVIEEKSSKQLIGICGLSKSDLLDGPALTYALGLEFCGKGYAVEACKGFGKVAGKCGYGKMYGMVLLENTRSAKVLRNTGMVLEDSKESRYKIFIPNSTQIHST